MLKYRGLKALRDDTDPLAWWEERSATLPLLRELALRILCVSASSASSERLFSKAGLTLTKQRSRLTGKRVWPSWSPCAGLSHPVSSTTTKCSVLVGGFSYQVVSPINACVWTAMVRALFFSTSGARGSGGGAENVFLLFCFSFRVLL